ncbi:MAG: hypothetical protein ACK5IN_09440 [Microbacterium sp.]|uniref:hypothetical protein n=1 Tax=Microbacterium sp. TaxID=51671 RepID=UPI003A8A3356
MHQATVVILKALIAALLALLLACQVFIVPTVAAQSAWHYHEIAYLQIPGIVVGAGLSLLVVMLRGLLRTAWRLEQDLSEAI